MKNLFNIIRQDPKIQVYNTPRNPQILRAFSHHLPEPKARIVLVITITILPVASEQMYLWTAEYTHNQTHSCNYFPNISVAPIKPTSGFNSQFHLLSDLRIMASRELLQGLKFR